MIWLMNVNVLFKFSENIKDSMGKFIMPLESELKEVKEKLGYAMVSVEKSTEQGLLSETVLQEKNYRQNWTTRSLFPINQHHDKI